MKINLKIISAMLILGASNIHAATVTSNLSVTATVNASCTVSTSPVAFGVYNPTASSDATTTGTVTVTCTNGTGYTVSLDAGSNPVTPADITTRRMKANTSDYLPYQLYQDGAHNTAWGDAGAAILTAQIGDGSAQNIPVYGVVTKNQYVPPGSYVDTVLVTVTYP